MKRATTLKAAIRGHENAESLRPVHRVNSPAAKGGKAGRGKTEGKGKKSTSSSKAGLQFPVGRMRRHELCRF
jgi:hypothetical protein